MTKHICLTALYEEKLSGFEVKLTEGPQYYISTACNFRYVSMSLVLAVTSSVLMGTDNFDTRLAYWEEIIQSKSRKMQKWCKTNQKIPIKILFHHSSLLSY